MDYSVTDIDLYQARMLIAFYKAGMSNTQGTMDAFVRNLPENRSFLVVCGVERILKYINELKFTSEKIETLKKALPEVEFTKDICDYLLGLNFSKELKVRAMLDGEIAFANEPIISISGPVGMVQYVEMVILNILNYDTRIASKAIRVRIVAGNRMLADYSSRRGGGPEAARAAYIAGFNSSSNVTAFERYGIPASGTMGHVWVMAHENEDDAYAEWSKFFENSTYLPDTYNTEDGTIKIIKKARGNIGAIRLDSGNLAELQARVRRLLSNADQYKTTVGATNDLDEYKIKVLLDAGCKFEWFGVGTQLASTPDSPTCSFIYKLVEINGRSVAKIAADGKGTIPGTKQVYRLYDKFGDGFKFSKDIICLANEPSPDKDARALLIDCSSKENGTAEQYRNLCMLHLSQMPNYLKVIEKQSDDMKYPVELSDALREATAEFIKLRGKR